MNNTTGNVVESPLLKQLTALPEKTMRCTKPWTSIEERTLEGDYRVCCWTYSQVQAGRVPKDSNQSVMDLWNNDAMLQFRKAMAADKISNTCMPRCPVLRNRQYYFNQHELYDYDPAEYATFPKEFRENRERVMTLIQSKHTSLPTYPLRLKLHPSNVCNLACPFCDLDTKLRMPVGKAYYDKAYNLMPYLEELLIFGGEPFACKVTKEIIFSDEFKRHPQLHFSCVTNGALLSENMQEKLRRVRLGWFSFSLDSFQEETYKKIRVNSNYKDAFTNLRNFVARRDKGDIRIVGVTACCVINKDNFREIADFTSNAIALKINPSFSLVDGGNELLDHIDEVKAGLEAGLAIAKGRSPVAYNSLASLLNLLPAYRSGLIRRNYYSKIFKVVSQDRIRNFLKSRPMIKSIINKMIGI